MDSLTGKTAVVTGAASGMGLAFAKRFAAEGMRIVLSDIEEPALDAAVAEVTALGAEAIGVITDVADGEAVDALGRAALEAFGSVNVVCNNAGVAGGVGSGAPHEISAADWKWVIDVNLWGVIHGHRVFLPMLMEHGDGHIINTASMAGHFPGHSAYTASKWAVVGITEGLFAHLKQTGSTVGVSCLCPGWVDTKIIESDRNRPEWAAPNALVEPSEESVVRTEFIRDLLKAGMKPDDVAGLVHDAILNDSFWIFTDMGMVGMLEDHHTSIRENRNPSHAPLIG